LRRARNDPTNRGLVLQLKEVTQLLVIGAFELTFSLIVRNLQTVGQLALLDFLRNLAGNFLFDYIDFAEEDNLDEILTLSTVLVERDLTNQNILELLQANLRSSIVREARQPLIF
jgi:hypothetical protein